MMTIDEVLSILIATTAIVFWICDTIKYLSAGSASTKSCVFELPNGSMNELAFDYLHCTFVTILYLLCPAKVTLIDTSSSH